MKKSLLLFFVFGNVGVFAQAQESVTKQTLAWYSALKHLQINERWSWQTDMGERIYIDPFAQHQMLIRTHAHYHFGKSGWEVSAGFCVFGQSPNEPITKQRLMVPELRPHIEVAYKNRLKHFTLDHRFRAEARFFHGTNSFRTELADGFSFGNFRFRYRITTTIPILHIDEHRSFKMKIGDEVMVNAGAKIAKNIFDQNRLFVALSIDVLPQLSIDAGYLNWYQMRENGAFFNRHIITLATQYTIRLKKK